MSGFGELEPMPQIRGLDTVRIDRLFADGAGHEWLAVLVDALDHVPVELELADDDGGKSIPPARN